MLQMAEDVLNLPSALLSTIVAVDFLTTDGGMSTAKIITWARDFAASARERDRARQKNVMSYAETQGVLQMRGRVAYLRLPPEARGIWLMHAHDVKNVPQSVVIDFTSAEKVTVTARTRRYHLASRAELMELLRTASGRHLSVFFHSTTQTVDDDPGHLAEQPT